MTNIVVKETYNEVNKEEHLSYKLGKRRAENKPKNVPVSAFFCKIVSIDEMPVIFDRQSFRLTSSCRQTNGLFTIVYNPEGSPKYVKGKPYCIAQDLIHGRFCFSGPRHFHAVCDRIPEFAWLEKWTTFDDSLFKIAKQHPGVLFGFNIRWADYADMIEKKAEKMNLDIDHKPFFCYITTKEKLDALKEKYTMMPNPTKEDYATVLADLEKEKE